MGNSWTLQRVTASTVTAAQATRPGSFLEAKSDLEGLYGMQAHAWQAGAELQAGPGWCAGSEAAGAASHHPGPVHLPRNCQAGQQLCAQAPGHQRRADPGRVCREAAGGAGLSAGSPQHRGRFLLVANTLQVIRFATSPPFDIYMCRPQSQSRTPQGHMFLAHGPAGSCSLCKI